MKTIIRLSGMLFAVLLLVTLTSCNNSTPSGPEVQDINPFSNGSNERNLIVVLSDVHLGADLAYAEIKNNLPALEKLLKKIKASPNVKELVIAGDLLDEWFVPAPLDTYQGKNQADFVQRIATANKGVIDAFNAIIQEGKILVTYVPGNHDLTITAENVSLIMPGINQARDEKGLGTYTPAGLPQLAVEHGHRYNFFCAPDPLTNQTIAPGTITPPGYFFTRIAALHVQQKYPPAGDTVKIIVPDPAYDESQRLLYTYWKIWEWALNFLTIKNKFNEQLIVTNIDGFTGTFSVNDLVPFQTSPGGALDVSLYKGIQDSWKQRQILNRVPVEIPTDRAIVNSSSFTETDEQAKMQYFMNPSSNKRLVVFGHSHDPKIVASQNTAGEKCIYANSGTWIDDNPKRTKMNFVIITPQSSVPTTQTFVRLYNFEKEVFTKMAEESVRF